MLVVSVCIYIECLTQCCVVVALVKRGSTVYTADDPTVETSHK